MLFLTIDFSEPDTRQLFDAKKIKHEATWQFYYDNYNTALASVLEEGLNRNYYLNSKARGVLFLLRHSFELCLKLNLESLGIAIPVSHDFAEIVKSFPDQTIIPDTFNQAVNMVNFDTSGSSFRYYFDKNAKKPFFRFKDMIEVAGVIRLYNSIPATPSFCFGHICKAFDYDNRKARWDLTFHVGQSYHLGAIRSEFTGVVEFIISLILNGQVTFQQVYLPLLFMIRHSMELILKSNITDIQELSALIKADDYQNEHSLARLYNVYNDYLSKVDTKKLPKEALDQYNQYKTRYEKLNAVIHQLDSHSRQFRYPVDKNGDAQKIDMSKIDFIGILELLYYTNPFILFTNAVLNENGLIV